MDIVQIKTKDDRQTARGGAFACDGEGVCRMHLCIRARSLLEARALAAVAFALAVAIESAG